MSLAYKLWKIGSVLSEDDIKASIKEEPSFKDGDEPIYLNINFDFKDNKIIDINLNKDSVTKDKLFFTKKIGGSGTGIYYLYPNLSIQKENPIKKISQIEKSLEQVVIKNCKPSQKFKIALILYTFLLSDLKFEDKSNDKNIDKVKKDLQKANPSWDEYFDDKEFVVTKNNEDEIVSILKELNTLNKDNYIIYLTINNKTFFEEMPEVWDNWYKTPVEYDKLKDGYDMLTNQKSKIGYKTDVKVLSYDQYHDSLKHRTIENLPLSLESARNIKFAWIYILDNLVFYFKGLEYIIIPNIISDKDDIYRLIIERLVQAKKSTDTKKGVLERLNKEEKSLKSKIEKLKKKKSECSKEEKKLDRITSDIEKKDLGIIQEFNEQLLTIDEHINSVTIDYLFTKIDRTNKSFEIKGTIEDVIPSKMGKLVNTMRDFKIEDLVKLGAKDKDKTYLQDFFNRDELYFAVNSSSLNKANSIFTERLYLAKLLLSDNKIKREDLLKRFEFNRLHDYEHKKRIRNGIAEWIEYPNSFVNKENNIIKFLTTLNKIKE